MIQGTMSNAGKSLLAAGLCRIFMQDGYRVAPFKSQNMALNSFITQDGLEMGRAQVMQAEAAGIAPDIRMNPILLKPTTDTGSQVIVMGEVLGDMDARKYFAYKKSLMPMVLEAYSSLAAENDIIVIEGAGSPAEINLKQDDIVNMGLAKAVGAPVLLVGDIDRGGVFAQLLGTQMLLEPDEQALLKGFIINKFRGDKTILDPGVSMLEERGGIPVVGVVPFMQLDIDDEDSLAPRLSQTNRPPVGKPVEIAVIRLPHLSNFTDFNVFSRIPEVDLRYVSRPEAIGDPDMVILPGTKNTIEDLQWLRRSGMETVIRSLHAQGRVIFGVCGGYQMLGEQVSDPYGMEAGKGELNPELYGTEAGKDELISDSYGMKAGRETQAGQSRTIEGLGFLPVETVFSKEKRRTRVCGRIGALPGTLQELEGMEIEGYEIHMGRTLIRENSEAGSETADAFSVIREQQSRGGDRDLQSRGGDGECAGGQKASANNMDGAASQNVYGTYVHGVFDAPGVAWKIAQILAEQKGIALNRGESESTEGLDDPMAYKETQYDLLADTLREHLDMDKIYGILFGEAQT